MNKMSDQDYNEESDKFGRIVEKPTQENDNTRKEHGKFLRWE